MVHWYEWERYGCFGARARFCFLIVTGCMGSVVVSLLGCFAVRSTGGVMLSLTLSVSQRTPGC